MRYRLGFSLLWGTVTSGTRYPSVTFKNHSSIIVSRGKVTGATGKFKDCSVLLSRVKFASAPGLKGVSKPF